MPIIQGGFQQRHKSTADATAANEYKMYRIESHKITLGQPIEQSIVMGMGLA